MQFHTTLGLCLTEWAEFLQYFGKTSRKIFLAWFASKLVIHCLDWICIPGSSGWFSTWDFATIRKYSSLTEKCTGVRPICNKTFISDFISLMDTNITYQHQHHNPSVRNNPQCVCMCVCVCVEYNAAGLFLYDEKKSVILLLSVYCCNVNHSLIRRKMQTINYPS